MCVSFLPLISLAGEIGPQVWLKLVSSKAQLCYVGALRGSHWDLYFKGVNAQLKVNRISIVVNDRGLVNFAVEQLYLSGSNEHE